MKGIDIFCASQAATAIRLMSMDEGSSSSSSTIHLGSGRAIDRYNPIIRDASRIGKVPSTPRAPCSSSQEPINPKPRNYHHNKNSRKNPSSKANDHQYQTKKIISSKQNDHQKRKSTTTTSVEPITSDSITKKSWGCTKPGEFISPPGSSRYLLSDQKSFLDVLSDDFDPVLALVPVEPNSKLYSSVNKKIDQSSTASNPATSSSHSPDQVVVLKVSLHCKGCERKMRKHISRMEGVTSFNIDFAAKKLTVVGDVTPLAVLASVSKVKNAKLLTPPLSSSIPCSNIPGIKKDKGIVV